jgi:ABC-type uncharacterized transport system substrate-binding protein
MYASREFVDAGGLMVYASNVFDLYRRTATYVDKILKGPNLPSFPWSVRTSLSWSSTRRRVTVAVLAALGRTRDDQT